MNLLSKKSDLYKRLPLFLGSVGLLVILFIGFENLIVRWAAFGVLLGMALIALWELSAICRAKGAVYSYGWVAAFTCLWIWLQSGLGWGTFGEDALPVFRYALLAALFIGTFLMHFRRVEGAILDTAATFFSFAYIALPLGLFAGLLFGYDSFDGFEAKWWIFYLVITTKLGDIAGYLAGKSFEGPKIIPKISPHKTYIGSLFNLLIPALFSLWFASSYLGLGYVRAFILGLIIAFFGMLGDLAESLLKRDAAFKDSNSVAGMGGMLDMVDSLLFSTAVFAIYLLY